MTRETDFNSAGDSTPFSHLCFDASYAALGAPFVSEVYPNFPGQARLVCSSADMLKLLGLNTHQLSSKAYQQIFTGHNKLNDQIATAQCYAGHQFGHWVPQLGDGRVASLGELLDEQGNRWDLQIKGAGVTPYSRGGDGRAVLRSSIREFLASEAMHALGIPTTRALALYTSHDFFVQRETQEPAALLVRLAASHIRFGTFEYFYHRGDDKALRQLLDYCLHYLYPEFESQPDAVNLFAREVVTRTAQMIAKWQAVGFCHGVMNTDNFSILGLTLDYGPYGFMEAWAPDHVCNTSDVTGRYAFNQQPLIGRWNCMAFLSCLLKEITQAQAKAALDEYDRVFNASYQKAMCQKMGLSGQEEGDYALINEFLNQIYGQDYTLCFRALSEVGLQPSVKNELTQNSTLQGWLSKYKDRLTRESISAEQRQIKMNVCNPLYILRNHLAQRAITQSEQGDDAYLHTLHHVLQSPYQMQQGMDDFSQPPPEGACKIDVSCSS